MALSGLSTAGIHSGPGKHEHTRAPAVGKHEHTRAPATAVGTTSYRHDAPQPAPSTQYRSQPQGLEDKMAQRAEKGSLQPFPCDQEEDNLQVQENKFQSPHI